MGLPPAAGDRSSQPPPAQRWGWGRLSHRSVLRCELHDVQPLHIRHVVSDGHGTVRPSGEFSLVPRFWPSGQGRESDGRSPVESSARGTGGHGNDTSDLATGVVFLHAYCRGSANFPCNNTLIVLFVMQLSRVQINGTTVSPAHTHANYT
jgi:hypothetical protein